MELVPAIKYCLFQKYACVDGRASRSEYWWFILFFAVCIIVLLIIEAIIGTFGILSGLFYLAFILPLFGVTVRRLHDINRSGWWYLAYMIPITGGILQIVWNVTKGTDGDNRFGSDPLSVTPQENQPQ